MSLAKFEMLNTTIEKLKEEHISNFIDNDYYAGVETPDHTAVIDVDKIIQYVQENDRYATGIRIEQSLDSQE